MTFQLPHATEPKSELAAARVHPVSKSETFFKDLLKSKPDQYQYTPGIGSFLNKIITYYPMRAKFHLDGLTNS
jgi:hypothetical protein